MFPSFAAGKQSYPNNVGHAVLDVFYVFCRLRNLNAQDIVGHAVLKVFFSMSWLSDRFSYPEHCWTCRVALVYVPCRLHYSWMSGRAQNYVGHAVLDFFPSPAVCIALG